MSNLGGVFRENDPTRKTKWRAEKVVHLPGGRKKRLRVRGHTRAEALEKLAVRERQELRLHGATSDKASLEEFLRNRWLADLEGRVKTRTLREYRQVMENHVIPRIGMIRLQDLRPVHVQDMMTDILQSESEKVRGGQPAKLYATANNARRYLRQALNHALDLEILMGNPVARVKPIKNVRAARGTWAPHEIKAFLETAQVVLQNPTYYYLFYVAFFTGLRRGELLALPWSNVTREGIVVDRAYGRDEPGKIGPPKNEESYRTVPIGPDVYERLMEQRARVGGELVFPNRVGGLLEDGNTNRAWRTVLYRVRGLDAHGEPIDRETAKHPILPDLRYISLHGTRRCAATYWARKGFPPKLIQELLGHATPHLALEAYNEVLDEQREGAFLSEDDVFSSGARD